MVRGRYNDNRRALFRANAARIAAPDEDTNMDVDVETVAESSVATTANANNFDPTTAGITAEDSAPMASEQDDAGDEDSETLNLDSIAEALTVAVNDHSDENLAALLHAADFDAGTLANWALDNHNIGRSATLLLSTAVMLSDVKTSDAESKAAEAHSKAAEAHDKAAEAHNKAVAAGHNCDGIFKHSHENAQVILTQAAHLGRLEHRVTALEGLPPIPSASAPNDMAEADQNTTLRRQLAATNALLQAVEEQLDKHREVALLLPTLGRLDAMNELMGRMQLLAELRERAETDQFERRDRARCQEVDGFRAQLATSRKENAATTAVLTEVLFQFRRMRMYLIAFFEGDLTREELKERFAELRVSGATAGC
ncbi:hypothetical protein NEMBOFW57_004210 [Staphylotrichum longicolle]|uniref:Uncharacterized protein n=1 Tax=Staphylotrichum longicolle TaxID=669026 RepID=A0AAD4F964_9PEZI|nr:hypothetical protein NEMBOFW57_004210 [Staphylotrichum longicolle]